MMANNNLVLNIIMNASDKASAAFDRARAAASALGGNIGQLQGELKGLERAQKMVVERVKLEAAMRQNSREIIANRQAQQALRQEIGQTGVATKQQAAALEKLTRQGEALRQSQAKNGKELTDLNNKLKQYGITARQAQQAQEQLQQRHQATAAALEREKAAVLRLERARAGLNEAGQKRNAALGVAATYGGAAMVAKNALAAPVQAYAEAESAGTELRMAMMDSGGQVSARFQEIDTLAARLGDRLPGTTADFKNLMTMLLRQGVSAENILGGTGEAAALLAVQLKKTPEAAAEMAAKLQDATRATEAEMLGLMDSVQRLYYAGVDDGNILGAFSKLSPALDIVKLKGEAAIKTFSPLIGMLDQAGLSGESAGNALRKVFSLAMDTQKIAKATEDTGISLDFTDGKGEFGGVENMYRQLAKLQQLNTETRLSVIKDIFGDDAETMQALNTMIEKGQAGYDEFAAKMAAQASLNQRVNEQLGTLSNLWDAASGTFTNLLASLGESIAPELKALTTWIGDINQKMSIWAKNNPQTAALLMKTAAAIGVAAAVVAVLAAGFAALVLPIAAVKFAWVYLLGSLAGGAGTIGKIALALKGTFWSALSQGLTGLKLFAGQSAQLLSALGSRLLVFGRSLISGMGGALKWLLQFGRLAFSGLAQAVLGLSRAFMFLGSAALRGMLMVARAMLTNPIGIAVTVAVGVLYLLWRNWDRIWGWIKSKWEWLKSVFADSPIGRAVDAALASLNSLMAGFDRMIAKARQAWQALDVGQAAGNAWSKAKSWAGFSRGGYTGAGGVNEAAGIVHKGEVVFSQRDIARFGGWQAVERLRRGGLAALSDGLLPRAAEKLGSVLGFGGGQRHLPRPNGFVPPRAGGAVAVGGDTVTIHIHAAPTHSVQNIAEAVRRELMRLRAAKQRRAGSSFKDRD